MTITCKSVSEEKKCLKESRHQEVQSHMADVRSRFLTQWQTTHTHQTDEAPQPQKSTTTSVKVG